MKTESQQPNARNAEGGWLGVTWRCREVAKPAPFAKGLLAGYVGSNPTSASKKGAAYAAATMKEIASRTNHNP
jgi:hypothetical protein